MNHRIGSSLAVAALVTIGMVYEPGSALAADSNINNTKPNFIIIFTDDMGYGDLGIFGNPTIKTPHLD
ncbi:MAG TPA: arylsulfatase, partial [Mariniphaga sp.]|nr:arylsulfatase [Mariniphaga sp.]